MGRYKVNNDGTLGAMISGRGKAEYGASHYEHGEKEEQTTVENYTDFNITFNTPFPDTNYEVIAEYSRDYEYFATPSITKSTTGMIVRAYLQPASFGTPRAIGLKWSAFKLYTDTEYNNILAAMPSDASASNKLVTESELNAIGEVQVKAISITGGQTRTMTFPIESNRSYTYSVQKYSDSDGYHSFARTVRNMNSSDYDAAGVVKLQWAMLGTTATLSVQNTGNNNATLTVFVTLIK